MKDTRSNPETKKAAGVAAAALVEDGMILGAGTGSTVVFFIEELGRRVRNEGLHVIAVPTSFQSRLLCLELGIPVRDMQDCASLDLAVDGADEVAPSLDLIKGGGASHTREKIVAAMAKRFVVVADESKLVPRLHTAFPIPIEVLPQALAFVERAVRDLDATPTLRMAGGKDGPVITDNGQLVLDLRFPPETDLRAADRRLHELPGVIDTGLFFDLASQAVVASGEPGHVTVRTLSRQR